MTFLESAGTYLSQPQDLTLLDREEHMGSHRVSTWKIGSAAVALTVCLVAAAILMFPPAAPLAGILLGYKIVVLTGLGAGTFGTSLWYASRQFEKGESRLSAMLSYFRTPEEIQKCLAKLEAGTPSTGTGAKTTGGKVETLISKLEGLSAIETDWILRACHKEQRRSDLISRNGNIDNTLDIISIAVDTAIGHLRHDRDNEH